MARRAAGRGARTSLPPAELRALTDRLVADFQSELTRIGIEIGPPITTALSPEEIVVWSNILEDARDLELDAAPSAGDYASAGVGLTTAVLGLGLSFVGPIGSVVWAVGLVIGGVGGIGSLWGGRKVIKSDMDCMIHLNAITSAQEILQVAATRK